MPTQDLNRKVEVFLHHNRQQLVLPAEPVPRTGSTPGQYMAYPGSQVMPTQDLNRNVEVFICVTIYVSYD